MATLILDSCQLYVAGQDLSGVSNQLQMNAQADEVECTTFGSAGFKEYKPGLLMSNGQFTGYSQFAEPDASIFADLRTSRVVTIGVDDTDGATAYATQGFSTSYQPWGGTVGSMAGFQYNLRGDSPVGKGFMGLEKQTVSGNTTGTGAQIASGIAADQKLAMSIHVFTAGTTADVNVESDDNAGFTSATERLTQTVTATGGYWVETSGAITDDYYRVTVDTVTGSFSLAVAVVRV